MLGRDTGSVKAVDGVSFSLQPGRGARPRRGVRERQDDAVAGRALAWSRPRLGRSCSTARPSRAVRTAIPPPAQADAAHLPGPSRLAQPGDDDLDGGRSPARDPPHRRGRRRRPPSRVRGPRTGRPRAGRAVPVQVPERPLGRPEAARGSRPGDHPWAGARDGRRAGLDARHERAGQGAPADGGPEARSSASPISTSPTTLRPHATSATASRSCTSGG